MLTTINVTTPAHIAARHPQTSAETRAWCAEATAAIARLEQQSEYVAGLGFLLARSEAVASSRVEHICSDLDAFEQASIIHGQFETIHPFTDGNGRSGRALISATFRRRGVTQSATVPIAAAMLADTALYFDKLAAYQGGDIDTLVAYIAHCTAIASREGEASVCALAAMPEQWRPQLGRVVARRPTR